VNPAWICSIYSIALKPDAVFYLRLGVEQLIRRVIFSRGFDYWESGMDLYPGLDMYESFCNYQEALLAEFDRLRAEYRFETIDASSDVRVVFSLLQERILGVLGTRHTHPSRPTAKPEKPTTNEILTEETALSAESYAMAFAFRPFAARAPSTSGNGNGNGHGWLHRE
jgi:hypothetical protein